MTRKCPIPQSTRLNDQKELLQTSINLRNNIKRSLLVLQINDESCSIRKSQDENALEFLTRAYKFATNSTKKGQIANIYFKIEQDLEKLSALQDSITTEVFDIASIFQEVTCINPFSTCNSANLIFSKRIPELYAQYSPGRNENRLLDCTENLIFAILMQMDSEIICKTVNPKVNPKIDISAFESISDAVRNLHDICKVLEEPKVSIIDLVSVEYDGNIWETITKGIEEANEKLENNFAGVVHTRYADHNDFLRAKRRVSSSVKNLAQIISETNGEKFAEALSTIHINDTFEFKQRLEATIFEGGDFSIFKKAPELFELLSTFRDNFIYWLLHNEKTNSLLYEIAKAAE